MQNSPNRTESRWRWLVGLTGRLAPWMAAGAALELPVGRTVKDEAMAVAVVTAQAVAVTTSHAHPGPRAALPESLWPTSAIEEWTAAALTDLCASTCVKFNEAVVPWSRWKGIREAAHAPLG
jgi:hypothetical protein